MKQIRKMADDFFCKQNIETLPVTWEHLTAIIQKYDWVLCTYSEGKDLIQELNLAEYRDRCLGFTYYHKDITIIFISDKIGAAQRLKVISHEIGHIVLQHTSVDHVLGKSTSVATENIQEVEADIFALEFRAPIFKLANDGFHSVQKIYKAGILPLEEAKRQFHEYRKTYIVSGLLNTPFIKIFIILFVSAAICFPLKSIVSPAHDTIVPHNDSATPVPASDTVFVTPSGKKFHCPDCFTIQNSHKQAISRQEAIEFGYGMCQICNP